MGVLIIYSKPEEMDPQVLRGVYINVDVHYEPDGGKADYIKEGYTATLEKTKQNNVYKLSEEIGQ